MLRLLHSKLAKYTNLTQDKGSPSAPHKLMTLLSTFLVAFAFAASMNALLSLGAYANSKSIQFLYPEPKAGTIEHLADFVGRDQDILSIINFDPDEVDTRMQQIQSAEQAFQTIPSKSTEAMQAGVSLLNLHLQQAVYLENLRGVGLKDKRFPDINHFIKVSRRNTIALSRKLLSDYPKSPHIRKWKVTEIDSLMRIGDETVYNDAIKFIRANKNSAESSRIQALGYTLFTLKATKQNYGTLQNVLALSLDGHSSAVIKLLAAEALYPKNKNSSMKLFQEAAREGLGLKRPGGGNGPVTSWASTRLLSTALSGKPVQVNSDIVSFFQSMGQTDHLKTYFERCAFNNLPKNPATAIDNYESINALAGVSDSEKKKIDAQTLQIALASGNIPLIEERWKRFSRYEDEMKTKETLTSIVRTQTLAFKNFSTKSSQANIEQFVRLHDFFSKLSPSYANEDSWKLKSVEALSKGQQYSEVSGRADLIAQDTKSRPVKLAALRYSARAKENLLGITEAPNFKPATDLKGGNGMALAYIGVLANIQPLVTGPERERSSFQQAYLTYMIKSKDEGKDVFLKTLSANSKSSLASPSAVFLLSETVTDKDYVFAEKLGRSLEKLKIKVADKRFSNLRNVVEVAVYEQANALAQKKQNQQAAEKYVAFQLEFPKSKNADQALHLASRNFTAANQVDKSIKQMERLLELYPKSALAKETGWAAAEQSKSIGQLLRAANHYSAFATSYPKEGLDRKAWFLAAELHKSLGRFSHSIASYEQYLNSTKNIEQKILVAREIAGMQHKYGSAPEALASYDRVIKISGRRTEEAWARYQMMEILLRQGMEREARAVSKNLLALTVSDKESLTYQVRARFSLGKLDASQLEKAEPMREANLVLAIQNLLKNYSATKQDLISTCEVPGFEWCSVGYYEAAKLAETIAGKLVGVKPPPTIDPALAQKVSALVQLETEKLAGESRAYAIQAETALSQGAPDAETAELIRSYAQRSKGRDSSDLPR